MYRRVQTGMVAVACVLLLAAAAAGGLFYLKERSRAVSLAHQVKGLEARLAALQRKEAADLKSENSLVKKMSNELEREGRELGAARAALSTTTTTAQGSPPR